MRIDHVALFCRNLEAMRQFFLDYFEAVSNELYHNPRTGLRTYILSFTEVTEQREPSSSLEWSSRDGTRQSHSSTRLELMQRPDVADADPSKPNIGSHPQKAAKLAKYQIK
jgi:lactoylglutathione lyase